MRGRRPPRRPIVVLLCLAVAAVTARQPSRGLELPPEDSPTNPQSLSQILRYSGPLPVLTPFVLSLGFLELQPSSAAVLPRGAWQARMTLTGANYFATSFTLLEVLLARDSRIALTRRDLESVADSAPTGRLYFVDAEAYRTELELSRGFGHRSEFYVVLPVVSAVAGRLDGLIESFHSAFGLSQEGRQGVPRNEFTLFLRYGDEEFYVGEPPGISLGDISAGGKFGLLSRPGTFDLALNAELKMPTGKQARLAGSGSVDAGAQLLALWMGRRDSFHGAVGLRRLGANDLIGMDPQTVASGLVAWEHMLGRRHSVLLQISASGGVFEQFHLRALQDNAIQGTLGVKRVLRHGDIVFAGITENLEHFGNTPDVAFHLGWIRSFSGAKRSNSDPN